jgi:hypothetical protein
VHKVSRALCAFICRICADLSPSGSNASSRVDIYDSIAATWRSEELSAPRENLIATSLPSQGLALFAGGDGTLWK